MAKRRVVLLFLMVSLFSLSSVRVSADNPKDIDLTVGYTDPGNGGQMPRTPIVIPRVAIDDYELTFYTPCDGCTLQLLDENESVAFATVIPIGATTLVLPSYLSGTYQIQIISGNICFWGYIDL